MKEKNMFWLAGFSAAVGGMVGAVCGSSSLLVVAIVGAVMSFLITWGIVGFFK